MSYSNLELDIIEYNAQYRNGAASISDQQYDYLMELLKKEQPDSQLLKTGVIDTAKESRKESLPIPMYSLEKDKSVDEFKKYLANNGLADDTECLISPKLDGISLVVAERPKTAWTRGDGEVGQNSTIHFAKMGGASTVSKDVYSYGEAILSKPNWMKHFFGKISPHTGKPYKSARNLVGGLLNADEARDELKYVDYIRYGISSDADKSEVLQFCNTLNGVAFKYIVCKANTITDELLDGLYNEWSVDYQIDGVVIDINNYDLREKLGRERNGNPKYARAIKLPQWGETTITKVSNITLQVSKQGNLKPVINIEPVDIGGATISNVTGYNMKYVFENGIAIGSVIEMTRSGDVIPKHLTTISYIYSEVEALKSRVTTCPCCSSVTKWDDTHTELYCPNPKCEDQQIGKLIHFFKTLEVEEFGEPTIIKMYKAGYVTPLDVLQMGYDEIIDIEGFAHKSTTNLLKEFQKLKEKGTTVSKLIHATDVMGGKLGSKTIQLILDDLGGYDPYFQSVERLVEIKGVAELSAIQFNMGMGEFLNDEYQSLFDYVKINNTKIDVMGTKFNGYKLCFTGVRPSGEQEAVIKANGGEIVSGVSKNTTHLVVKDLSDKTLKSEKSMKAQSLGIEIITLETLLK